MRDVADAQLAAMITPEAAGKRFVLAIEHASMLDIATILRDKFADRGFKVPTRKVPGWLLKLVSVWDKTAKLAVPELGKRQDVSHQRATELLGWHPRPLDEMVTSMGESMIQHGVVRGKGQRSVTATS